MVLTGDGALKIRSDAALHLGDRLGGTWRVLAILAKAVPRPLRDIGYDLVARMRRRLFRAPAGVCPVLPKHLLERFDP